MLMVFLFFVAKQLMYMIKQILVILSAVFLLQCSKENVDKDAASTEEIYEVSTYAGKESAGKTDGKREVAEFDYPSGLAIDSKDNLYIVDASNWSVRIIKSDGIVSTINAKSAPFSGSPNRISVASDDEIIITQIYPSDHVLCKTYSEKNGLKNFILDTTPMDILDTGPAVKDSKGDYIFVGNSSLHKISSKLVVEKDWVKNIDISATMLDGNIITIDKNDIIYTLPSDFQSLFNGQIKTISPDKSIKYITGDHSNSDKIAYKDIDGALPKAAIGYVTGLCVDKNGVIYFIENSIKTGCRVRKISNNIVTTLAGGTEQGYKDGVGIEAKFGYLSGIAVDSKGNVFVSDDNRIRKISKVVK